MTDDSSIQNEVYKLLWMFKDECPYLKNWISVRKNHGCLETTLADFHCQMAVISDKEAVWTILSEILPKRIDPYDSYELTIRPYSNKVNYHCSEPAEDLFNVKFDQPDIWQSLLSLLKVIQEHPDRDKFEFVWRK